MSAANFLKGKISPWKQMYFAWRSNKNVPFRKKFFIGYDLDGNTFWEFKNYNDPYRMRRIVEYRIPNLNYVDYKAPPQWIQWLRHTRPNPPSLEELYADQVRQANLKGLVEQADIRWKSIPLKDAKATATKKQDPYLPPSGDERMMNKKPIKAQSRS